MTFCCFFILLIPIVVSLGCINVIMFVCLSVDVQTVLSAVIMCGPPSVQLDKPVILSFPHCASVKHGQWSLTLFTSHSTFDDPPAWHVSTLSHCGLVYLSLDDVDVRKTRRPPPSYECFAV